MEKQMRKQILLTGACGYIGHILLYHLTAQNYGITTLDKRDCPKDLFPYPERHRKIHLGRGLLSENDDLGVERFDAVVHLAAIATVPECEKDPEEAWRTNVIGTREIHNYAIRRNIPLFINADSSMSGLSPSTYAKTKEAALEGLYGSSPEGKPAIINLKFFNVAGASGTIGEAHDPETHFIPNLIKARLTGIPFDLDSRNPKRDFVHVDDVCSAITRCIALSPMVGHFSYEVGTGKAYHLSEVLELANRLPFASPLLPRYENEIPYREVNMGADRWEPDPRVPFFSNQSYWVPGWKPQYNIGDILDTEFSYREFELRCRAKAAT